MLMLMLMLYSLCFISCSFMVNDHLSKVLSIVWRCNVDTKLLFWFFPGYIFYNYILYMNRIFTAPSASI